MKSQYLKLLSALVLIASSAEAFHDSRKFADSDDRKAVLIPSQEHRLALDSGWFYVDEEDLGFQASFSGWDPKRDARVSSLNIGTKALAMIQDASDFIVASAFLFDNMYAENLSYDRDIVTEFTDAIIKKKQENPNIKIALIFDPLQRAYERRQAPSIKRMRENGIDIFYSDLLRTKAHTPIKVFEAGHHTMRLFSQMLGGLPNTALKSITQNIPVPMAPAIDDYPSSLQTAFNAALVKANHRKILVVGGKDYYEALVSSANPHNASLPSSNNSMSVRGDLALYIYESLREDIRQCLHHGTEDYVLWNTSASEEYKASYLKEQLKPVNLDKLDRGSGTAKVKYVTEIKIKESIIKNLDAVYGNDKVRIQMFYLSDIDVVRAIARAAQRVNRPIEILLDPNKDAFNSIKDGTPNRQVAAFLMNRVQQGDYKKLAKHFPSILNDRGMYYPLNIHLRWFHTNGEQNHAKTMSITNEMTGKYILINGSSNWTGKNLNNINLEANLVTDGAIAVTEKFNRFFDKFFFNQGDKIYSLNYENQEGYHEHAGINKWLKGEKYGFVSW